MERPDLFFNLDDATAGITRELAPGVSTRVFVGDQAMLSFASLGPNRAGSTHTHPEEQWGVLLRGSGTRMQDGVEVAVAEGDFWCTPANTVHGFVAGPDGAEILDIFAPPREAYRTPGSGYGA